MADFLTSVDIANRALQHCGAGRVTSFTEDSRNAAAVAFCYDKLRRAELRRNVWRFATRKAVLRPIQPSTMELIPPAYVTSDTYIVGSVVIMNSLIYIANGDVAANATPGESALWDLYYGPMTVNLWDSTEAYFSGELVYTPQSTAFEIYLSLQSSNSDNPTTPPAFDATVVYKDGDTVTYMSALWQSKVDLNIDNTPASGAFWETIPGTQPTQMAGQKWLRLNATLKGLTFVYPIGSGPATQSATRNVFQLPNGFLREAPQDPKAGSVSFLGAPSGLVYNDWTFEGNYIVSREINPIVFRFVADVADVTAMDDMFCEGFAARIAIEVCEELTQSADKLQSIGSAYAHFMAEARTVNGIETGSTEPPEDDYLTCRI